MFIKAVDNGESFKYQNHNLSFKSKIIFDVGASDPRASLKVKYMDNNGKDLFDYKDFVNEATDGFEDKNDFVKKIANALNIESYIDRDILSKKKQLKDINVSDHRRDELEISLNNLLSKKLILNNQTPEEKKITGFVLMLPGTIQSKIALFMANVRDKNKKSLLGVNLNAVIPVAKSMGKVEFSDKFNPETDYVACKDLAGTGMGIAQKIVNHPEYSKRISRGFFAVGVQTGGGFGAVDILVKGENDKVPFNDLILETRTSESSHNLFFDRKTGIEKRLGKMGASTSSVIENFAKEFGITDEKDIKVLVSTGLAQLATQKNLKLGTESNADAIEVLLKTNAYEIYDKDIKHSFLKLKDSQISKFDVASKYAVEAYAETLALHAITKINDGANLYVISGPLAMGLNDRVIEAPNLFEKAKGLRDVVFKFIDERVGKDQTCNILREANNFDIVCDKSMSIADNTSGGKLFLAGKLKTFSNRGEWMELPIKALKHAI